MAAADTRSGTETEPRSRCWVLEPAVPDRLALLFVQSWAIPKGIPEDQKKNHLAVRTEDHPLEYAAFEGEIPQGQYGAGLVKIWDRGTYECEKWADREVKVVLHGKRARGRYVLFRTRGDAAGTRAVPPA